MKVVWSVEASADLVRLHAFLQPANPRAAARVVQLLMQTVDSLGAVPRKGPPVPNGDGLEMRKLIAQDYDVRYEILHGEVHILPIFHGREDR